jgi:hypothetical protein
MAQSLSSMQGAGSNAYRKTVPGMLFFVARAALT